jgi:hypothetical protein
VANPKITITGDSTGAVAAIKRLKTEMGGLQSLAAKAVTFTFAGLSAAAFVEITRKVIDTGDALNKMSQSTGIAVEDLSKLQYAADLSGVSTEALGKGLTALAVNMATAATGVGPVADQFKQLGINVRNTDGNLKSSGAVLTELADKFAALPDGVEKTNLAVDIFGKRLGAEMIPLLNLGAAGLKAMGEEAESLGLVMGADLAKKSEEFNDNLERMSKLSSSAGIQIANSLIPPLNALITEFLDARKANLSFLESLIGIGLSDPSKGPAEQIARISAELEKLNAKKAAGKLPFFGNIDEDIAKLEKLRNYYSLQLARQTGDGVQSAQELSSKRISIETQLQVKLAALAQLQAIAAGKVSAEILQTDAKRIDAQIANANKLRASLQAAWEGSKADAIAAGIAVKSLLEQAGTVRQAGADKAAAKLRSALTPEQQQQEVGSKFDELAGNAESAVLLAKIAGYNGRVENAAKLAKQAAADAERASSLADQLDDPAAAAAAIERVAEIQAQLLESQAAAKKKEQADAEERAAAQIAIINELDVQLTELQAKAAAIVVQADISAAQGAIATLQAQLAAIQDKTVTVTVVRKGEGGAAGDFSTGATGSFARGGYTGPGGKWQPAGIVHAGEFVLRQEVTRQAGAIEFLRRFNQIGVGALKGYASGGLVSGLNMPSLRSSTPSAGSNATFVFPGMGTYPAQLQPKVMDDLKTAFAREALKKGGRR